jgi:hypothetical protein
MPPSGVGRKLIQIIPTCRKKSHERKPRFPLISKNPILEEDEP